MAAPPSKPPKRPGQKPLPLLEPAGGDDDEVDAVAPAPAATGFFAALNSLAMPAFELGAVPDELGTEPAADRLSVLAVDVALEGVEAPTLEDPVVVEADEDADRSLDDLLSILLVADASVEPGDAVLSDDVGPDDVWPGDVWVASLFTGLAFGSWPDVWDLDPGEVFGRLPRLRAITILPFEFDTANAVRYLRLSTPDFLDLAYRGTAYQCCN
jgi:hypothetical protein